MRTEIWAFRVEVHEPRTAAAPDLAGYAVEATDGEIGHVSEVSYADGRGLVAVDTGPWILGRTVLLPAGTIERVDAEGRRVHVALTKEQIEQAPPLALEDRTPEDEEALGTYYARR